MKPDWVKAVILWVVIAVVVISAYYFSGEAARNYHMLPIIDKALLEATEDTPDYIGQYGRIHFQNSISLQTLRDAIKEAKMEFDMYQAIEQVFLVSFILVHTNKPEEPPSVYVGDQGIGYSRYFYIYPPEGIKWHVFIDDKYEELIQFYWGQIREGDDGLGMVLENGGPREEARSYMLGIINEALLEATDDTPDYLEPDMSRLYFRNSISLQTLHDIVKDAYIHQSSLPPNPRNPVSFVGDQEIGYGRFLYWEYGGIWWGIGGILNPTIRTYLFQIEETGDGFGMYPTVQVTNSLDHDPNYMQQITPTSPNTPRYLQVKSGESATLHADLDGSESLILEVQGDYLTNITVQRPDGSISLHFEYPNTTVFKLLVIPVDEVGTWSVTVTNADRTSHQTYCTLRLFTRPAAVKLELPEVTDDPHLLRRLVGEMPGTIVVTENEERLSLSQPLSEGMHDLRFQRVLADGRESIVTRYCLTVDSHATEAHIG